MRLRRTLFTWFRTAPHPPSDDAPAAVLSLADLQAHERGRVLELACGRAAANRLVSLGFTPGAEIDMTHNYGRGPLIVTVRGGRVAVGRGEARRIRVERSTA